MITLFPDLRIELLATVVLAGSAVAAFSPLGWTSLRKTPCRIPQTRKPRNDA